MARVLSNRRFCESVNNSVSKQDVMHLMDILDAVDFTREQHACVRLADRFERLYSNMSEEPIELSQIKKSLISSKDIIHGMKEDINHISDKLDSIINKFDL